MTGAIDHLFSSANALRAQGDEAGWRAQMDAILTLDPNEPRALNALGNAALHAGHLEEAQGLFERAVHIQPNVPALWFNLAQLYAQLGQMGPHRAALERTLALDPYFVAALLSLGALEEHAGRRAAAADYYRNALAAQGDQPATGGLAKMLDHGRTSVAAADAARARHLEAQLQSIESGLTAADGARFTACRRAFAGEMRIYESRATYLKYPFLPALQFYDRALFPWIGAVEAKTDAIRAEYLAIQRSADFAPYIHFDAGQPLDQWAKLNHSQDWDCYHLWEHGARDAAHCAACPETVAAIAAINQPVIAANAPNLMFSRLKPRTHIPPHSGMTNTRLVVHLPLIVPPGCTFRVGHESRTWEVGKAWVFDDSIEHEAHNESDADRVILMWDIWNPFLSPEECRAIAALVEADTQFKG